MKPPGILLLVGGVGAGLATGLLHFPDPAFAAGATIIAACLLRDEWWVAVLPALGVGILMGAHAVTAARGSCAARMPAGEQRFTLHLIDPGEGTGSAWVVRPRFPSTERAIAEACHGTIAVRWPENAELPAGVTVSAVARWSPVERPLGQPDGVLIVRVADSVRGTPGAIDRIRTAMFRNARALYGSRAPLADALISGNRSEVAPDLRQAFAAAGLIHLLGLAGFQIGILAAWALLGLRLARVPRRPAELLAALAALAYAAVLGWPIAAVRAATLALLVVFCRWRQRQVQPAALLGASALVIMAGSAWAIANVGAWLSILGVAGMIVATRWSDRAIKPAVWIRSVSSSTGATLATAPVTAAVFGQVAPIGIVLNVVGMPLVACTVPVVFLSVTLYSVTISGAKALAASGNLLLFLLQGLARLGAQAPGAGVLGPATWQSALPWLAVLGAALWAVWRYTTVIEAARRIVWAGTAAAWATLLVGWHSTAAVGRNELTLLFLDVGQGDAALVRTPGGRWIEIDAGPTERGWDAGQRVVAPVLAQQGVRQLDLFVLSHAHRDHVGGATAVLRNVPVGLAIEPGELFADSAYATWLDALAKGHTRWRPVSGGTRWSLDGVQFRVLHPPQAWAPWGDDLNEDSIVLEVTYGTFRALFMGDAGFVAESSLTGSIGRVDFLKVGHHGSATATSATFLAAVRPQAAVVSVGQNHYGHPAPATLARLDDAGVMVWRTDRDGTVTVETDGVHFTVRSARGIRTLDATARTARRRRRARPHQSHHPRALHSRPGAFASGRHQRTHQSAV